MPWRPRFPGERPTLGYYALDWIVDNLAAPDRMDYEPFYPTVEQAEFLLQFYELDPITGKRIISRAVLSRARGWGKSPFLSAVALLEGLGEIVPDGWNAQGRPVGRPWGTLRMPVVTVAAATEDQVANSWTALLEMVREDAPAMDNYIGLEPMQTRVNLPYGYIKPASNSAVSSKGGRPIFVLADQALALDTPIPTPAGWSTMGELCTGDLVFGSDGQPTRVVEAKPVMRDHPCYRVTFADHTSVVASEGHLWSAKPGTNAALPLRTVTTRDLLDGRDWYIPSKAQPFIRIRSVEPVESVPVRCIAVEAADHLFAFGQAGHLTHNTEQWTSQRSGHKFMNVLINNTVKVGGSLIEAPNAYIPGEDSVAERSAKAFYAQRDGRTLAKAGILYDHREAPADTSMTDRESLEEGLRYAYGCSSADPRGCVLHNPPCQPGWADIEDRINRIWQDDAREQDSRADFLNQITFATDAWLGHLEWEAVKKLDRIVSPHEPIVLGFDGSRGRSKDKPDATALIGCCVLDAHLFEVGVWEVGDQKELWADWEPPIGEIEDTIESWFTNYNVVGMYCDPRDWRSYVNKWEARYLRKLQVKSTLKHPMEWWMTGGRLSQIEQIEEEFEKAVQLGDLSHGGYGGLTRHVLNARRRDRGGFVVIDKDTQSSPRKIDAAIAAVLAYRARNDAVAAGVSMTRSLTVPSRIR